MTTSKERQAAMRERRASAGQKELRNIWVTDKQEAQLRIIIKDWLEADKMNNLKVENGKLIKNGSVLIKVGDIFQEKLNDFRRCKVIFIDLHFIRFEKIAVGEFELNQLGRIEERQTAHFLNNDFDLIKTNVFFEAKNLDELLEMLNNSKEIGEGVLCELPKFGGKC